MKRFKIIAVFIGLWGQHSLGHATEEVKSPSPTGRMPFVVLINQAQGSDIARFLARKGVQTESSESDDISAPPKAIPELLITEPSEEKALPQEEKKSRRKKSSKKKHGELAPLEDPIKNSYPPKGNFYTPERKVLHEAQGLQKIGDIVTVTEVEQPDLSPFNSSNVPSIDKPLEETKDIESILSPKKRRGKKEKRDPTYNYVTLSKRNLPQSEELAQVDKKIVPVPGKKISDKG